MYPSPVTRRLPIPVACLLVALLPCAVLLGREEEAGKDIPMTRWMSPHGEQPGTYAEYLARRGPPRPFQAVPGKNLDGNPGDSGRLLLVLVDPGYYVHVQDELAEYAADVAREGFFTETIIVSGGTPQDVRDLLKDRYTTYGAAFAGVLLVGDLPVPWYDISGDQFPSDLYYMDLDGAFFDDNGDGIFDRHEDGPGDTAPDIFLGRLVPTTLNGTAVDTLERYFKKIHAFRQGSYNVPRRALAFCDDDWAHWGTYGLDRAFDDLTIIDDFDQTSAENYEAELDGGYHWIHTMAHSYSGGHHFATSTGGGWTFNYEVDAIEPWALFYQLFACSNCRYTDPDYMGGVYIFCKHHGLAAVGSTKAGSMLSFQYFYDPLHRCLPLGDAYRAWWQAMYPYSPGDESWFYGLTLLGDPVLSARPGCYEGKAAGPAAFSPYPPLRAPAPLTGAGFGHAVIMADFDHDGFPDIAVGEPRAAAGGTAAAGRVHLFFGPDLSESVMLTATTPAAGEAFGASLASADLNGDGIPDLLVGIPGRDAAGYVGAGSIRVFYGPDLTGGPEISCPAPVHRAGFGTSLLAADFDGDALPDLAAGAPGGGEGGFVEIYRGPNLESWLHLDPNDYGLHSEFGAAMAAGDLNGDDFQDLVITAPGASFHGAFMAFLGPSLTWPVKPAGWGPGLLDRFGQAVAVADFDGDGLADAAVGAPGAAVGGTTAAGGVHLFRGPNLFFWKTLSAPAPEAYAGFGSALAAADFDGDGTMELCASAPLEDAGDILDAGKIHRFEGPNLVPCTSIDPPLPERCAGFGTILASGPLFQGMPALAAGTPRADLDPEGAPVFHAGEVRLFAFMLEADKKTIPAATGGDVVLSLNAGAPRAGRTYVTALSVSGTVPGTPMGSVTIPLNFDAVTNLGFLYMNTPFFLDFGGTLDSQGRGTSVFHLPGGLNGVVGLRIYFAFFTLAPVDFASNPAAVDIE